MWTPDEGCVNPAFANAFPGGFQLRAGALHGKLFVR
jgi:hypothetical protein